MKIFVVTLVLSMVVFVSLFAQDKQEKEKAGLYENNTFTIRSLYDPDEKGTFQILAMSLKPTDHFAPNINIYVQEYSRSLKEYSDLSIDQFKKTKVTVLKKELKDDKLTLEYSGVLRDLKIHWYAKAIKKGNQIYLVTATAKESQWKDVSSKLITCVDSFQLK